jgi:hypothetical protein
VKALLHGAQHREALAFRKFAMKQERKDESQWPIKNKETNSPAH